MNTIQRVSPTNLFISWASIAAALSLASLAAGYMAFGMIIYSTISFILNLAISAVAAWPVYRYYFHKKLSMDDEQFTVEIGRREKVSGRWSEFDEVSLMHFGRGRMGIRLYYRDKDDFVEIPASDLKLDASDLRFKAIELTKKGQASNGKQG